MTEEEPPDATVVVGDDDASIERAAAVLGRGGLVAVPTETVYGLAADASDPGAVARVFAAKGRPADHPLIVHLPAGSGLDAWAAEVPEAARVLADAFWPGPLTLVLPRHPSVSPVVTGGLATVAVRVPAHPVAQRLLAAFGGGLAAPSANRFGRVSPTTAEDVLADLDGSIDLIVDGGPCEVGVESTIVEVTDHGVGVLRPGGVAPEDLSAALGRPVDIAPAGPSRAPGMLPSHYAPDTPIELCDASEVGPYAASLTGRGKRVGVLSTDPLGAVDAVVSWHADGDVVAFAHSLYRWLRRADDEDLHVLLVVPPPPTGIGLAVADRLRRAAHR
jgi:L-threonylcarbamoyladenylate synthase